MSRAWKRLGRDVWSLTVVGILASALAHGPARAADPTIPQCLAAAEGALALRRQHKLRDARSELVICSARTCPADVRAECVRRVGEVNAALPTVVFEAKDVAGDDLSAVRVTIDGQPLALVLDGAALAIDPGLHVFVFETPGQQPVRKQFVIREGDRERHERITLGVAAVGPPPAARTTAALSAPLAGDVPLSSAPVLVAGDSSPSTPKAWGARKKWGAALGAAGAAGLVTGVVFTAVRQGRANDFNNSHCSTALDESGPPGCQSLRDGVNSASHLMIAGYASGVVLGGVAAYLFFAFPADSVSAVALRSRWFGVRCLPSGGAGISCGGQF